MGKFFIGAGKSVASVKGLNPFGLRGGHGVFGKNGLRIGQCASLGGGKYTIYGGAMPAHSFVIDKDKNVGMGVTSPTSKLHVDGIITCDDLLKTSDIRLKSNLTNLEYGLNDILKLKTYKYHLYDDPKKKAKFGILAQEVKEIIPEMTSSFIYTDDLDDKSINPNNGKEFLSIQSDAIQYILVNAVQEQQKLIEEKDAYIRSVEARLEKVERSLEKLLKVKSGK